MDSLDSLDGAIEISEFAGEKRLSRRPSCEGCLDKPGQKPRSWSLLKACPCTGVQRRDMESALPYCLIAAARYSNEPPIHPSHQSRLASTLLFRRTVPNVVPTQSGRQAATLLDEPLSRVAIWFRRMAAKPGSHAATLLTTLKGGVSRAMLVIEHCERQFTMSGIEPCAAFGVRAGGRGQETDPSHGNPCRTRCLP